MKMLLVILFYTIGLVRAGTLIDTRASEGYPGGYLSDCPGAHSPAVITEKNKKHITLVVQGEGNGMEARRKRYSYYHMKELANDSDMNPRRRTVIYIGGFLDSPTFPFARLLGAQYKQLGYNVLHTDSNHFLTMHYPLVVRLVRPLARNFAEMLVNLTKEGVINPKTIEVVGLSLGGQIMSYLAKDFRSMTGMNISTLIGLDPAGPCYRKLPVYDKLNPSDADFVSVIHTSIDIFGIATPSGHADFYVNGGEIQAGDVVWTPCGLFCSHIRSYTIWLTALKYPNGFIGIQCESVQQARDRECYDRVPQVTNVLGHKTDRNKQGIFYLNTDNNYPYFLGKKGLKKEHDYFNSLLKVDDENVLYF